MNHVQIHVGDSREVLSEFPDDHFDCVGVEVNPAYAEQARQRLTKEAGLFAKVEVVS